MNILMLGWELPPRISGGLGKACAGLLSGIEQIGGMTVRFVLPTLFGDEQVRQSRWHQFYALDSQTNAPDVKRIVESKKSTSESGSSIAAATQMLGHQASLPSAYSADVMRDVLSYADKVVQLDWGDVPFDLVHAHDWLTFPAAANLLYRKKVSKLVVHVHSTELDRSDQPSEEIAEIEKMGMRMAEKIVAVSHYTRKRLVDDYAQDPAKIEVIYNAPDSLTEVILPRGRTEKLVTFIGRITQQKGPTNFVEAACKVILKIPDVRFVMAGDGDLLSSTKALVAGRGMAHLFTFPGFLANEDIANLLSRSSVLVMPSLAEPFGLVAAEAIQAGVPVVLSRRSGIAEVVDAVLSVDPTDTDEISAAIVRLLQDDGLSHSLSQRAALQLRRLTWRASAQRLHRLYTGVLNGL